MMTGALLALNAGSSSTKFAVFDDELDVLGRGELESDGRSVRGHATDGAGVALEGFADLATDLDGALGELLTWIDRFLGDRTLAAVGHRVVHGGRQFDRPVRVTEEVLAALVALTPLAPLHQRVWGGSP